MEKHFYHMFANGDDAKNFITNETEFKIAFNRFAVCQHLTEVTVLSISVEDSHPHALLYGYLDECLKFKDQYEAMSIRSIIQQRGSSDGVVLKCELLLIDDNQHLMNTGTYIISQATKDGKSIMPYDYLYGTGALYFRSPHTILPWLIDENGKQMEPTRYGDLSYCEKRKICGTKHLLPDDWLVCNGFILPTNYIDINRFESIYKTHNCFRVFLASNKAKDEAIIQRMAQQRGLMIEDLQARKLCKDLCFSLFGITSVKGLRPEQRLTLAQQLRRKFNLSIRQLAILVGISEPELQKYIH